MKSKNIARFEDRLDGLFQSQPFAAESDEIRAHWGRYLCVLTCGYLEVSVTTLLTDYSQKCANQTVGRYVASQLGRFRNPGYAKIEELVSMFDKSWAGKLRVLADGEIRDHVTSLVSNRHLIAHGKDSDVTIARAKDWYGSSKRLVTEIERLLNC